VDKSSEPPLHFYQRFGAIAGLDRVAPTLVTSELRNPVQLEAEVARLKGRRRVWLVFTAHLSDPGGREDGFIRQTLDRLGHRLDAAEARGYFALLYDFTGPEPRQSHALGAHVAREESGDAGLAVGGGRERLAIEDAAELIEGDVASAEDHPHPL